MNKKKTEAPIFIGGIYRSGTSLLRAMLCRHSNIAGGLETFWFDLDFDGKARLGESVRHWDGTRTESLDIHTTRLADYFDMDRNAVASMVNTCAGAEEFTDRFMAKYAAGLGKSRWAEKTPANVLYIDRIFAFWPKAAFIHVVRDPRDVYSSVRRTGKWSEPESFAKLWVHFMRAYEIGKNSASPKAMIEVRYEDLVADPVSTMSRVLHFLNEPWEEAVAGFQGDPADFDKVRRLTGKSSATLKQLAKPLVENRVGAWRNELGNLEDLSELERIIADAGFASLWEKYKCRR